MTDQTRAEEFAARVLRMIEPLSLPEYDLALVQETLRYAYLQGYRDCNAVWTWQQIMERRR